MRLKKNLGVLAGLLFMNASPGLSQELLVAVKSLAPETALELAKNSQASCQASLA